MLHTQASSRRAIIHVGFCMAQEIDKIKTKSITIYYKFTCQWSHRALVVVALLSLMLSCHGINFGRSLKYINLKFELFSSILGIFSLIFNFFVCVHIKVFF
jgi:hypothetical protein